MLWQSQMGENYSGMKLNSKRGDEYYSSAGEFLPPVNLCINLKPSLLSHIPHSLMFCPSLKISFMSSILHPHPIPANQTFRQTSLLFLISDAFYKTCSFVSKRNALSCDIANMCTHNIAKFCCCVQNHMFSIHFKKCGIKRHIRIWGMLVCQVA